MTANYAIQKLLIQLITKRIFYRTHCRREDLPFNHEEEEEADHINNENNIIQELEMIF